MKTGIKFKPCNVGTAEAHNRRDQAYCEAVARKFGHTYFWDEYRHLNRSWRNPSYTMTLPELLEQQKIEVKQKTEHAMQCRMVKYTDKKTGRQMERVGCASIREGCPPIKPDTRIEDFEPFVRWLEGFRLNVISIDLHHDEGHEDEETGELVPNHHAHVIIDWIDHSTGTTVKLTPADCKMVQTVLAESLCMERGTPKEDTGIEGLSAIEFKEKMAKESVRKLKKEQAEIEKKKEATQKEVEQLETKRKEKQKALDQESGNALKSGLANLLGKGKYAEIERENSRLREDIAAANTERDNALEQVTVMETKVARIPQLAEEKARAIVLKKEEQHEQDFQKAAKRYNDTISSLRLEYSELERQFQSYKETSGDKIERLENEKTELLNRLRIMLDMLMEALRKAVIAVKEYSKSIFKEFTMTHRETIAAYLASTTDPKQSAEIIKAFVRPHLDDRQYAKGSRELDRLVSNLPTVLQDMSQERRRSLRR